MTNRQLAERIRGDLSILQARGNNQASVGLMIRGNRSFLEELAEAEAFRDQFTQDDVAAFDQLGRLLYRAAKQQ